MTRNSSSEKSGEDEMTEENDARCSLLNYYSSQTTSHGVILVTIALVALASVQLRESLKPTWFTLCLATWFAWCLATWFTSLMSILVAVAFRTFGRLLYWGSLSNKILEVDEKLSTPDVEAMKRNEDRIVKGLTNPNLMTFRLHNAAVRAVKEDHRFTRLLGQAGWESIGLMVAVGACSLFVLSPDTPALVKAEIVVVILVVYIVGFYLYARYTAWIARKRAAKLTERESVKV